MSIAALTLLAALAGSPPVQDQAAPRPDTRSVVRVLTWDGEGPGRLDADGDGVVTREEFSTPMGSAFDRLDTDHDGRLSVEEMAADDGEGPGPHRFIIREEGPHGPGGDVRVFTRRMEGPGAPGGDDDVFVIHADRLEGGPGQRRFLIHTDGPDGPGRMDADGDGRVSEAEFLAPLREAFQRMDKDHDGSLDEDENGAPPPPPPPSR